MKAAGGISALVSAVALLVAPSSSHAQFQFPPSDTTLRCAPAMGGQIEEGVAEAGEPERSSVICFSSTGGPVSYAATTPGHGAVSDAHSARGGFYFVYTATPAYRGPDGFKVIASDGQNVASVDVAFNVVDPVNEAPFCQSIRFDGYNPDNAKVKFPADKPIAGQLGCTDDEHGAVAYSVLQPPVHGSVSTPRAEPYPTEYAGFGSQGAFTFTPEAGYSGHDDFTLRATDGVNCSNVTVAYSVKTGAPNPAQTYAQTKGCAQPPARPPLIEGLASAGEIRVPTRGSSGSRSR